MRVGSAHVAEQGQVGAVGGGLGDGERHAEDRVCAQLALVVRAVQVDHDLVDEALLRGVEADHLGGDLVDDGVNRLLDALAQVTALVAIAALDSFESTGGGTRGDRCTRERAVLKSNLDLNCGVAARVENLAGADGLNAGHDAPIVVPRERPSMGFSPVSLSR